MDETPHPDGDEVIPGVSSKIIGPVVAMGLTFAARKGMNAAYLRKTGHEPPIASDEGVPIAKVIVWSVAMAAVSTVIETVVTRYVSKNMSDDLAANPELESTESLPPVQ